MKITAWYCFDKKVNNYIYNHFEEGHVNTNYPLPKKDSNGIEYNSQKCWKNMKWEKEYKMLVNNKIYSLDYV